MGYLTALAAIIGSVVPVTAAIIGMYETRVASEQFKSDLRLKYLDRAIDPARDPVYRESVLRFLSSTFDEGDDMKRWAEIELANVSELLRLRHELEKNKNRLTKTYLLLEQEKATSEMAASRARENQLTLLQDIDSLKGRIAELETALHVAERNGMAKEVPEFSRRIGRGETILIIARRCYDVDTMDRPSVKKLSLEIARINNLDPNLVDAGQQIKLPARVGSSRLEDHCMSSES